MKPFLLLPLLFVIVSFLANAQTDPYIRQWSDVYRYELKALPKPALAVVDTIYARAKREKNMVQLTRALIYQSKFALTLQEDAELRIVQQFRKEIRESAPPLRNILESLLANIYWEYFATNRADYYDRSHTAAKVDAEDFRTWDGENLMREIDMLYRGSLHEAPLLQKISLASLDGLLVKAETSRLYRPTLYDLLAHHALDFYQSGESELTKPADPFKIDDPRYFESFENLPLSHADSTAPALIALKIFRQLLTFHRQAKDTTAYVNLETERLNFIVEAGSVGNETALHHEALNRLGDTYRRHPASALADFALASVLYREGLLYSPNTNTDYQYKKKEALAICNRTITSFPKSDGAERCGKLKEVILSPALNLTVEKYVPTDAPFRVLVEYANTDSLSWSAFRISDEFNERFYDMSDSLQQVELARLTPVMRWQTGLTNLGDYQDHRTEVIVRGLPEGRYLVLARVAGSDGIASDSIRAYASMQVTNLALIETTSFGNRYRYQVVDRNNGKPLEGADVHLWSDYTQNNEPKLDVHLIADSNGFIELVNDEYRPGVMVDVNHGSDHARFGNYHLYDLHDPQKEDDTYLEARSFLFSDRSIYRPGQTVQFKGILVHTKNKKSSVVSGQHVNVVMEDVNGEEVDGVRLKTNSFGSFSGSFRLPASGLTGEYTLYADQDTVDQEGFYEDLDDFEYSQLLISVEEYKRPTFETSFLAVKETFRLNDTITVKARATAFNGAKIGGARVSYHVKRTVNYSPVYSPHSRYRYSQPQEITSGEGTTDSDGNFEIRFRAIPDERAERKALPVFNYEVTMDITDVNGETRSATTSVKVGYHSLVATINAEALMNNRVPEHTVTLRTENLNGEPVNTQGTLSVFKLTPPAAPLRLRPWNKPDVQVIPEDEFLRLFPHDPYDDVNGPETWQKGKLMSEATFNTTLSGEVKLTLNKSWDPGSYVMELKTKDEQGTSISNRHYFKVFDPASKAVADKELVVFALDKPSYKPGELAKLTIGSASPNITFTIDVESHHKIVKTYVEHVSGNTRTLMIPITENMGDGFAVRYSAAAYNAFLEGVELATITREMPKLEIETITFKDKLQPGARETWSFEVKGNDPLRKEAEVLASMYDASLDQFRPHTWNFDPIRQNKYFSSSSTSAYQSFGEQQFTVRNQYYPFYPDQRQTYDHFDWFGFNISDHAYANRQYLNRLYSSGLYANTPSKVRMSNDKTLNKGYIYGTITDSDGEPLQGVNVVIRGTTRGTVTDREGHYVIEAGKGDVLVYSFIGFSTAEAAASRKKNTINVRMEEDVTALSEIVFTAYGERMEMKSQAYASSVAYSDSDTTAADSVIPGDVLHGRIPGIAFYHKMEVPRLVIRGAASVGTTAPLYVVDGMVVESSTIAQHDLAAMEILKGEEAKALYGARAANGVVIITTKQGQQKLDEALARISARKNFNETAFFFPHLTTNENGHVRFTFTTPEALTRWKLQLLAHNSGLATATKTLTSVTQKELMVTPNAPRFLRTGDDIVFSAKVANLTAGNKEGSAALQLTDAVTGKPVDNLFRNTLRSQPFKVSAKGSTEVSWKLKVPPGVDAVQYKVVAKAGSFSDGEQNALPVLSDRMLVTESLPMQVRTGETRTFTLGKLKAATSPTLKHHQLTLEVTSNPAWYAVQALPYLMEFPHECAEQIFARYYANALASHITGSSARIREVFDKWASAQALVSNLEKNPELKSLVIQETPWLRDAQSETEQKKRFALLFDLHAVKDNAQAAVNKLEAMQMAGGGFPWFGGAKHASRYITQHIASGLGHLRHLHVPMDDKVIEIMRKAVAFLDAEILSDYNALLKEASLIRARATTEQEGIGKAKAYLERSHTHNEHIHYLYMRSFYPEIGLSEAVTPAVTYFKKQSAQHWRDFSLYLKAMIALVHHRDRHATLPADILRSLRASSITSDEMGMYWKDNKAGWHWNEAPVETQALVIEAFAAIDAGDTTLSEQEKQKTLDALRTWLLKNKQTNRWSSTKATTEAIYALLLHGTEWLSLQDQVAVTVGNRSTQPSKQDQQPETGTGYFKTSWKGAEVTPAMGEVTLTKKEAGMAWAALHWQYFEDLDKISAAETPLRLAKKVFVVTRTGKGELLTEVTASTPIKTGDLLRIRIELKADRPMEFLHMKDMRAAGLEPIDVLSGYKWQENVGYYQSTKDASTNFFFDQIPQGVYVFEYDLRVSSKGNFSNGITTIESMYAPEFRSHSEGVRIIVK